MAAAASTHEAARSIPPETAMSNILLATVAARFCGALENVSSGIWPTLSNSTFEMVVSRKSAMRWNVMPTSSHF